MSTQTAQRKSDEQLKYEIKGSSSLPLPEWALKANIYEVNIRQYTPEGTIAAFARHLPRLKKMGVDILWLMPVFPISKTKRKGTLGSYYAVSDYRAVNPEFGTKSDFRSLVELTHALDMRIVLDWVPNHTGWDHKWIRTKPEFYNKCKDGHITEPLNHFGEPMGWTDVADLNYSNRELRKAMIEDMLYWIREFNIDGYRQDMALLVPLDFWKEAVSALIAEKSDILMIAEAENHALANEHCFHILYAWSFHHILNEIARGHQNAHHVRQWVRDVRSGLKHGMYMHFTSNHDENSWNGSEIERMGEAHKSMAVIANTLDGIPLTYSGQEEPVEKRLEFFEKDLIPFSKLRNEKFYRILNELRHEHPALWHSYPPPTLSFINEDEHVLAYVRSTSGSYIYVILNLSNKPRPCRLLRDVSGKEIFTAKRINIKAGSEITLEPWEYLVIVH